MASGVVYQKVSSTTKKESPMRPLPIAVILTAIILVVFGSTRLFRAEAVEHHGYDVDFKQERENCLSCHNDKIAKSHSKCMPICLFGKSHPDNLDYPPADRINEFKPASVAQQYGVMFIDGKMNCVSCHSLLVKSRYHLRIENWENQLCNACHNK